ncbi:unnamed protein product [Callosobruchus maculatus]|uniref:Uncharacterized protein n=1 Tax=Callosobruchus maculatus TaxID=64391 RepID=A0A653BUS2_CALMS|nr:unnamed protein product [Callosobruchus maculatus]
MVLLQIGRIIRRQISNSVRLNKPGAYEGPGKTTIHILNREDELGLMIDGYSEVGFRLNNDMTVLGSMIIFPSVRNY